MALACNSITLQIQGCGGVLVTRLIHPRAAKGSKPFTIEGMHAMRLARPFLLPLLMATGAFVFIILASKRGAFSEMEAARS